jgi:dolichol-phosphate mannosyltransferase
MQSPLDRASFFSVGVLSVSVGFLFGIYLTYTWVRTGNIGFFSAVATTAAITFGTQLLLLDNLEQLTTRVLAHVHRTARPPPKHVGYETPFPDEVTVLVPTLNEAATIERVVDSFTAEGFENILVVDGNSSDGTAARAAAAGADVLCVPPRGKGDALREGVAAVETPYVVMVDGDGTYDASQVRRLLNVLGPGGYDHVIGNRFADMRPNAMTRLNQFGNRLINWMFEAIYRRPFDDILSGYRAFSVESFEQLDLTEDGFGIETEMSTECAKRGVRATSVPISYYPRPNGSVTNLSPVSDGGRILSALYRFGRTYNPLIYLTIGGIGALCGGGVIWSYVLFDAVVNDITHNILPVLATLFVVFGLQLVLFGRLASGILDIKHAIDDVRTRVVNQQRQPDP